MNKKLSRIVTTGLLACTLTFAGIASNETYADSGFDGGLYFTNPDGGTGEFYGYSSWSKTTSDEKTNLIFKYKPYNIFIYSKVTNEIAKLSEATALKSLEKANKDFVDGDLVGDYKDVSTGEIISGTVNESFEVINID